MIHYQTNNTDKETIYRLMRSKEVKKASDCIGTTGKPTDCIIYDNGEAVITALRFPDGTMCATNSETFRREINMMVDAFGEVPTITIVSGVSKNNRKYITVELAS